MAKKNKSLFPLKESVGCIRDEAGADPAQLLGLGNEGAQHHGLVLLEQHPLALHSSGLH